MPSDAAEQLPPTAEELAYEAKEVQLLLSKDLVKRAFVETERAITEAWKRAATTDERERCHAKLQGFLEWKSKVSALAGRQHLQIAKE